MALARTVSKTPRFRSKGLPQRGCRRLAQNLGCTSFSLSSTRATYRSISRPMFTISNIPYNPCRTRAVVSVASLSALEIEDKKIKYRRGAAPGRCKYFSLYLATSQLCFEYATGRDYPWCDACQREKWRKSLLIRRVWSCLWTTGTCNLEILRSICEGKNDREFRRWVEKFSNNDV